MENLKIVNLIDGNAGSIPTIIIETEDGIRINTGITYEDIENIRRQRKEGSE